MAFISRVISRCSVGPLMVNPSRKCSICFWLVSVTSDLVCVVTSSSVSSSTCSSCDNTGNPFLMASVRSVCWQCSETAHSCSVQASLTLHLTPSTARTAVCHFTRRKPSAVHHTQACYCFTSFQQNQYKLCIAAGVRGGSWDFGSNWAFSVRRCLCRLHNESWFLGGSGGSVAKALG